MWHILFFIIKFVLRDLLNSVKFIVLLWKFLHLENDTHAPLLPCFHGKRASRYEDVARKFRPSLAFEWQYFLQTATISTADTQRWCVVGTSVAGIKAAAIGRIFDIPEGQYEVSSPGRPYRTNPEGITNVPLGISILPVSSDDMSTQTLPSWCCGTFPVIGKLPLMEIQGKHDRFAEFRRGSRHSGRATPWQPPVAGPAMFMRDGAMHAAHWEYQGPAAAWSRGSFGLAKQKFRFECNRKLVVLHQTIIKQC